MARLLDATKNAKEVEEEMTLRPQRLNEYVGQEDLKNNFKVLY